jgi:aconitase A
MPIEMKNANNGIGVIFTGRSIITENEYLDSYKEHLSQDEDKYQMYRYGIHDWTAVTKVKVSSNAIRQVATLSIDAAKINPIVVTVLVATQDITFGLSNTSLGLAETHRLTQRYFLTQG